MMSAQIAAHVVMAIDLDSLAYRAEDLPQFVSSFDALIHEEDTAPQSIATPPATVAAPVRSIWQTDVIAVRMIWPCSWSTRRSGAVALVTGDDMVNSGERMKFIAARQCEALAKASGQALARMRAELRADSIRSLPPRSPHSGPSSTPPNQSRSCGASYDHRRAQQGTR